MQNKPDIEVYWDKISKSYGDNRQWNDLTQQQQDLIIQSVNVLLLVLNKQV